MRLPGGGTGFVDIPDAQEEADTEWEKETGWKQECCGAGDLVLIHGQLRSLSGLAVSCMLMISLRWSATSIAP